MNTAIRYWNQYGYETDVFDKYREAVRGSNRRSVRVLGILAMAVAVVIGIFGILRHEAPAGAVFCAFCFFCGAAGVWVTRSPDTNRKVILAVGYLLAASIFLLNIYGAVTTENDALWIGAELAVSCYLLDYASRIGLMQIVSYLILQLGWIAQGRHIDGTHQFFTFIYLLVGLVTFYSVNRTRVSLIMGREESQRQADTDLLTGLTIRTAAQKMIDDHLKTDEHGVMMLLDLDRFKSVNDRLGHQMGDKVLIEVAADLKKMFRNSDVLSRLGGDEFVVYMNSVPEKEWALQRAGQVVREVRRWVGDGTTNIQVSASVGIVMTDMVERNYDSLYRAADVAMYCAKRNGGNQALFYTPDMMKHAEEEENERHLTREVLRSDGEAREESAETELR